MVVGPIKRRRRARHRHRMAGLQRRVGPKMPPYVESTQPKPEQSRLGRGKGSTGSMFKTRAALLGLLTLLIVSGIAASTASASGLGWKVNGSPLTGTTTKQIKLQLKGTAVLKSPLAGVEIECKDSGSEGATIEANGQDKGRVTYSQCTVRTPVGCIVAEPIVTNPLKSYLAQAATQTGIVDVYEPTEGRVFVELKFSGSSCPTAFTQKPIGISGSIAGEVIPAGKEGQEGLVSFPTTAISIAKHNGEEKKLKLEILGDTSTFSGGYGARLQENVPFGAFAD